MAWRRGKFTLFMFTLQLAFIVLFAIFVRYDYGADAKYDLSNVHDKNAYLAKHNKTEKHGKNKLESYYGLFQDVHVMIFVGFGFLMTFLKRYAFSSVGLNLLIGSFCIQWSMLVHGFFHLHNGHIQIDVISMLLSDFASATVLITFGSMLGKLSPLQYVILALLEIPIFVTNEWLGLEVFQTVDVGGSMFVHIFGAFFGVACSFVLYTREIDDQAHKQAATYDQDLFSMIGTIFLWLFWPSFNSALASGDDRIRAILNTYLALATCAVVAIAMSAAVSKDKFNMEHLQNATLAGGVAVGTSADFMIEPWGAMTIGALAAIVSVFGFRFIPAAMQVLHIHDTCGVLYLHGLPGVLAAVIGVIAASRAEVEQYGPRCRYRPIREERPLEEKMRVHDTCGVINLHGLPGVLAGVIGVIAASFADVQDYGPSLYSIFPARVPMANTTAYTELYKDLDVEPGLGRTASDQASYQAVALAHTLAIACVGGALTGFILKLPIWNQPTDMFEDEPWFEIPYGYPPEFKDEVEKLQVRRKSELKHIGEVNLAAEGVEFTKI